MDINTIAEIPGSDPNAERQVVMVGGHLDSWTAGTGATDNGAGTMIAMEVMRILKALNVHPRRTIRIGLWSGEEQGLFGSRGYVKQHFGSRLCRPLPISRRCRSLCARRVPLELKPEWKTFRIFQRGQRHGQDPRHLSAGECGGGADLRAVDGADQGPGRNHEDDAEHGRDRSSVIRRGRHAGISVHPGRMDYESRTHHSNHGHVFERLQPGDLKQAADGGGNLCLQCRDARPDAAKKPLPRPELRRQAEAVAGGNSGRGRTGEVDSVEKWRRAEASPSRHFYFS